MSPAVWIAIYLPTFVLFFILIPSERRIITAKSRQRKKRGVQMSNDLIKSYIGKVCNISSGSFGPTFKRVRIIEVVDNWIKVEGKGKTDLINIDFIQNIKILSDKHQE
ncbi:hypothetical protein SAMN02745945_00384 [Peptoclostridium litorale DSM 5388]|uniref:Uncharacterized protein n=1 Tax=Peptoclostridium litorale DSM 5388 TaxID=1121324 RepID=A0A069RGF1_PEPLI|nr:hypothetical protein [Peptoclostridium litorale]KDR95245.1 hypothetical protein CLIT_11c02740 [Peptoclostridium litorale DSM 5388]SIN72820.1 hypothetical protein SAMN02745945_00384 [Peptoclostridium litorale DSM 5388]